MIDFVPTDAWLGATPKKDPKLDEILQYNEQFAKEAARGDLAPGSGLGGAPWVWIVGGVIVIGIVIASSGKIFK